MEKVLDSQWFQKLPLLRILRKQSMFAAQSLQIPSGLLRFRLLPTTTTILVVKFPFSCPYPFWQSSCCHSSKKSPFPSFSSRRAVHLSPVRTQNAMLLGPHWGHTCSTKCWGGDLLFYHCSNRLPKGRERRTTGIREDLRTDGDGEQEEGGGSRRKWK